MSTVPTSDTSLSTFLLFSFPMSPLRSARTSLLTAASCYLSISTYFFTVSGYLIFSSSLPRLRVAIVLYFLPVDSIDDDSFLFFEFTFLPPGTSISSNSHTKMGLQPDRTRLREMPPHGQYFLDHRPLLSLRRT